MSNVYKITSALIETTKRGYKLYKLQLNNSIWATQLLPLREHEKKHSKLYQLYVENNDSLNFLVGKYIATSLNQSEYGVQFSSIYSLDVLQDFKNELESSDGSAFSTKLPIFDFLLSQGRTVEFDGSIKVSAGFGDMRIANMKGVNICYKYDESKDHLNLNNIQQVFDKLYKDVSLPSCQGDSDSYYKIDYKEMAIVRMDHHVKVSYKMTTSGDYDKWFTTVILKIGDKLDGTSSKKNKKTKKKTSLSSLDETLFELLIKCRLQLADEYGVPPYIIFHDSTLEDMAKTRPSTIEEMGCISGVGENKLNKYGGAFLTIIQSSPFPNITK